MPRWAWLSSLALSIAGLAVSLYLTYEHYTASTSLVCAENSLISCKTVTTSDAAYLLGVPVALLGALYFVAMVIASLPRVWSERSPLIRRGRLIAAGVGVAFVIYLVFAELFVVNRICLWCTAVHVIAVALFAVVALGTAADDG